MTVLSQDRNTPQKDGVLYQPGVATGVKIYAGALVALNATGFATPGAAAVGLVSLGRAEEQVDNSLGLDGAVTVRCKRGVFRWANSADADAITAAEIGDACYIVDDQTVAKTSGGATRSPAGLVVDVDALGVWVDTGWNPVASAAGSLAAANNLSDVANAATARTNLGVRVDLGTPAIVVGAEAGGDTINVAIQLKTLAGADLAKRAAIMAYLSDDANGDSIAAAAPSGGVAIGTDGLAIPVVAGKAFQLVSESDGDIDLDIVEAAGATWYLILVLPNGDLVASGAITFAA